MRELYDLIKSLDATVSPKTLEIIQKKLHGICEKKYDGVGYFFLVLKQGFKIFPFLAINEKYELKEPFEEFYDNTTSHLYHFLKVNCIHSLLLKKDVDVQALAKFMGNQGTRPPQVAMNVYQKDYNLAHEIFETILKMFSYPAQEFQRMIQALGDYQQTSDQNRKLAIQKVYGDWITAHHRLAGNIEELLSRYSRVTFVIRYPLAKSRKDEIEPEGFHIFFEKAEFDLSYSQIRTSEFFRKSVYIPKGERRDRLDSLSLKRDLSSDDLFSFIYRIRGKNKLLFSLSLDYRNYLIQGVIPEPLEEKFGTRYPLPEQAKISNLVPDEQWAIMDSTKNIKYLIEKGENKFDVYQKIDEIPHITINPVKVGVLDIEDEFSDFLALKQQNSELKKLVVKLKESSERFAEMIRQQQQKMQLLEEALIKEREKRTSNTYTTTLEARIEELEGEISQLHQNMEQLQQEHSQIEQERQDALQKLELLAQIKNEQQLTTGLIQELSQKLHIPPEHILRLLSPELLENALHEQILKNSQTEHDEMANYTIKLAIKSKQVGQVIEKGLRDGQFSTHRVQEFFDKTIDPWDKKEVARQLAHQLATLIFPKIPDYKFESFFDFSTNPGGDACFMYPLDGNNLAICLVDLQGTGLEQSCNLFWIKVLLERMIRDFEDQSADKILFRIQKELTHVRQYNDDFHCFSGLVGILNTQEHSFNYLRAGVPQVYLYNRITSEGRFIKEYGVPRFGLKISDQYYQRKPEKIKLTSGDVLLLQTNGLIDCFGNYDTFDYLMKYLPQQNISEFLHEKVREKANGRPLTDDVYLLAMEYVHE